MAITIRVAACQFTHIVNKGYIDGDFLKNILMTRGDAFRPEEVTELLVSIAINSRDGWPKHSLHTSIQCWCPHLP
eukprot:57410-Pyramimonas_sp.AAC.1